MPRTTPQKIEGASGAPLRPRAEGDPLVARFLSDAGTERDDSRNTLLGYARDLGQFAEFTWGSASEPPYPWKAVAKDDARAFLVGLSRSDAAPTTVRRKLSALRSFYAHLVREGEIADSPLAMLRGPKRRRELPDVLSVAEVETLLETAREAARRAEAERTPADASIERAYLAWRDWALLEFLYGTGARIAEAAGLSQGAVDLRAGTALLFGKGRKERLAPLGRVAAEALGGLRERSVALFGRAAAARQAPVFLNRRAGRATTRLIERVFDSCATPSRRTCWTQARTCAPCRRCSATPRSRRRRSTRTCRSSASAPSTARPFRARSGRAPRGYSPGTVERGSSSRPSGPICSKAAMRFASRSCQTQAIPFLQRRAM